MASQRQMEAKLWARTVLVAGVGSGLEWFDFYVFTQLSSTISKVFFPETDAATAVLYSWAVVAAGFVVRPLGALLFGHIGDTSGRNRSLTLSIFVIAIATILMGALPGYNTPGHYSIGIAAPILLALLRMTQGLALGGEYCVAVIYISELAPVANRGLFVGVMMTSVNIGLILATAFAMVLVKLVPEDQMVIWGWRVPFLCASLTSFLAYYIRKGLPEPHTVAQARQRLQGLPIQSPTAAPATIKDPTSEASNTTLVNATANTGPLIKVEGEEHEEEGPAASDHHFPALPIGRVLRNNLFGLIFHVMYTAWVAGAFYAAVTWSMQHMKDEGVPTLAGQGILMVSLIPNAVGVLAVGYLLDKGMRALYANAAIVAVGVPAGFGVFYGVGSSVSLSYFALSLFQLVIGAGMAIAVLPCSRVYPSLERTTGFSVGYNMAYGVLGGTTPLIITAIQRGLPEGRRELAPSLWLALLGGVSLVGILMLRAYKPRLNRAYVAKLV